MTHTVSRTQVLRYRMRAQQLDRPTGDRPVTDAAVLDLGVQDTGPDGALWALAVRGVPVGRDDHAEDDLALAWTVRGAPHLYRRADLPAVAAAVRPFSEADAAKRIHDAARPLRDAGIAIGDALATVAETMQGVVTEPLPKGDVSGRLAATMPAPYLRWCRPCGATHLYEMPFRLAALPAGLELAPGTSPPVLRPLPGWPSGTVAALRDLGAPRAEPSRPDVIRTCLHLLGPARPADVAGYLDAPVKDVAHRLAAMREAGELTDVELDGAVHTLLAADVETLTGPAGDAEGVVRLLGPFDPLLQGRDRELLVPDAARRKELWPILGRPGAVLVQGEVVGTWRPRAAGSRLRVQVDPWVPWEASTAEAVDAQISRLAAFRRLTDAGRA